MKAKDGIATVWDGEEFSQVSQADADRLVKEDKAQDISSHFHSAMDLKFRKDFTGYKTREIRAEQNPQPAAVEKPVVEQAEKKVEVDESDWMNYRKRASEYFGLAYNKTTKAKTIEFMENHLGSET